MADPRFYDNRGPFTLARICAVAGVSLPEGCDGDAPVCDLASLDGAGPQHLTFYLGGAALADSFLATGAGFCFVPASGKQRAAPPAMVTISCGSVQHAFAAAAALFYPQPALGDWRQGESVHPTARIGKDVTLAPGVVIGPGVEIGDHSIIGPNTVIGRGVAIGAHCEIGAGASVAFAYLGDHVLVLAGAQIGQPGFGFASSAKGHVKIPQLGRVILQDHVEIGSCTGVDRGALGDTVIGEGSKIDNQVQIGHNCRIGRHCVIAGQAGLAGSCVLEDFVILGGQVGLGDHTHVGAGARMGARSGTGSAFDLPGGRDYGGAPAKPVREWARELYAVTQLAKRKRDGHE